MNITRESLLNMIEGLSAPYYDVRLILGDYQKVVGLANHSESLAEQLRIATDFHDIDYSVPYDFLKYNESDVIETGLQNGILDFDDNEVQFTSSSLTSWNPLNYGASTQYGFNVLDYTSVSNPVIYQCGRWILLAMSGIAIGNQVISITIPKDYFIGSLSIDPILNVPRDLRFYQFSLLYADSSSGYSITGGFSDLTTVPSVVSYFIVPSGNNYQIYLNVNVQTTGPTIFLPLLSLFGSQDYIETPSYILTGSTPTSLLIGTTFSTGGAISVATNNQIYPKKNFVDSSVCTDLAWDNYGLFNTTDVLLYAEDRLNHSLYDGQYSIFNPPPYYFVNQTTDFGTYAPNSLDSFFYNTSADFPQSGEVVYTSLFLSDDGNVNSTPQANMIVRCSDIINVANLNHPLKVTFEDQKDNVELSSFVLKLLTPARYGLKVKNAPGTHIADILEEHHVCVDAYNKNLYTFAMKPLGDFNLVKYMYYNVQMFSDALINTNYFLTYQKVFLSFVLNVFGSDYVIGQLKDIKQGTSSSILMNMIFKQLYSPSLYGEYTYLNFSAGALQLYYDSVVKNESTVIWDFEADEVDVLNVSLPADNIFEIYMPVYDACETPTGAYSANGLTFDYTLRMKFEYHNQNTLQKDLYLMASNYLLSDQEYDRRVSTGQSVLGYYKMGTLSERTSRTAGTVGTIREFYLYGYAGLIPDLKPGVSRSILTRVVQPSDPTQITEQQFIDNLIAQGYSDTTTPSINDLINDYLSSGGTFYTINNSQYNNQFSELSSSSLCVSTYNTIDPRYWNTSLIVPYFNQNPKFIEDRTYTTDIYFDVQNTGRLNFTGILQNVSVTDGNSGVESLAVLNAGSGLSDGTYTFTMSAPIGVGTYYSSGYSPGTCSIVVKNGSIQNATIIAPGAGYTYDFVFYPFFNPSSSSSSAPLHGMAMQLGGPKNQNIMFTSMSGPSFIQQSGTAGKLINNIIVNFSATTIGNTLIIGIFLDNVSNSITSITSLPAISFSRLFVPYQDATNLQTIEVWYANNINSSITSITVNMASIGNIAVHFSEFSGLTTGSLLDKRLNSDSSIVSSSATTGPTATTSYANEIWMSFFGLNGDNGAYGPWNLDATTNNGYTNAGSYKFTSGPLGNRVGHGIVMSYKIASTTGQAGNTITVGGGGGDIINSSIAFTLVAATQPSSTTTTPAPTTTTTTTPAPTTTTTTTPAPTTTTTSTSTTTKPISPSVTTAPIVQPALYVTLENRTLVNISVDPTGAIINNNSFTIVQNADKGFAFDFVLDNNAIIYQSNRSFYNPALIIVRLHNAKVRCDSFTIAESSLQTGVLENWGLQASPSASFSAFSNTTTNMDYLMYQSSFAWYLISPTKATVGDIELQLMLSSQASTIGDGYLRLDIYSDNQGAPGSLLYSSNKINYVDLILNQYTTYQFHMNYTFSYYNHFVNTDFSFSNNFWLVLNKIGYLGNAAIFIKANSTDVVTYYATLYNNTAYNQSGNILYNAKTNSADTSLTLNNISEQAFDDQLIIYKGITPLAGNSVVTIALKKINMLVGGITDPTIQISIEVQYTKSFVTTTLQSSYFTLDNITASFNNYNFVLSGFPSGITVIPIDATINYMKIKTSAIVSGGYLVVAKNGQPLVTAINAISDDFSTWYYDLVDPYVVFYAPNSTVYGTFNRQPSEMNNALPPPNTNRENLPFYYVEGWWNYTCDAILNKSLSIYPRAFRTAINKYTQPNSLWNYAGYANDIYVGIKYISGGITKEQIIKLTAYPSWNVRWWSQSALTYRVINELNTPIINEYDDNVSYQNSNIQGINEFLNAVFEGTFTPLYTATYNIKIQFSGSNSNVSSTTSSSTQPPTIHNTFGVKVYLNGVLSHDSWDQTETSAYLVFTIPYNLNNPAVSVRIEYYKGSATADNINIGVYWKPVYSLNYQLLGPSSSATTNNGEVLIDTNVDRILFLIVGKTYNELNQPFLGSPPNDRFLLRSQ